MSDTDTGCKSAGRKRPRTVPGRHDGACASTICTGCAPCPREHCRACGITHTLGTCPECVAESRDNLREIGRMCDSLPEEVECRGINGEAMMLLGPAADPEARGHLEASIRAGRVPADYLETADGELHPLFVLGSHLMVWQDALEHDDEGEVTVANAVDYLDRQLAYMADYPHVPFEDFATDVRKCREHLERVLHDGEQVDRGAPCMTCHRALQRVWGDDKREDGWECPRCRQWSSEAQYRLAVTQLHLTMADYLPARECAEVTHVKPGTIRAWVARGHVHARRDSDRTVYRVSDVEARRDRDNDEEAAS